MHCSLLAAHDTLITRYKVALFILVSNKPKRRVCLFIANALTNAHGREDKNRGAKLAASVIAVSFLPSVSFLPAPRANQMKR